MKPESLSKTEFVTLMAFMTSIIALAIDSMLPAFPQIKAEFHILSPEKMQMIIAYLFLGYSFGQLFFGPISDVFGRKAPIYWGFAIFILGSMLSGFAVNFEMFLWGRFLQGFGGAAPRIISLALVRDEYKGNAMAQIMSMVMTIFILVPAIAPSLGQVILFGFGWRAIFIVLFIVGLSAWIWFGLRQKETLPKSMRRHLNHEQIWYGVRETFSQSTTVACILVSGLLFGIFVGYLGAVQNIFTEIFGVGDQFPLFFGLLALSLGAASFFNSRLVMVLGMRKLIFIAFLCLATLSILFGLFLTYIQVGPPALWLFMTYMILAFFAVGFLFGNLNSLAMTPLGHVAGMASALLGFLQTTISVAVGVAIGRYFHHNVFPLVLSFGIVSLICIAILQLEKRFSQPKVPSI